MPRDATLKTAVGRAVETAADRAVETAADRAAEVTGMAWNTALKFGRVGERARIVAKLRDGEQAITDPTMCTVLAWIADAIAEDAEIDWSRLRDLNSRPTVYETSAPEGGGEGPEKRAGFDPDNGCDICGAAVRPAILLKLRTLGIKAACGICSWPYAKGNAKHADVIAWQAYENSATAEASVQTGANAAQRRASEEDAPAQGRKASACPGGTAPDPFSPACVACKGTREVLARRRAPTGATSFEVHPCPECSR